MLPLGSLGTPTGVTTSPVAAPFALGLMAPGSITQWWAAAVSDRQFMVGSRMNEGPPTVVGGPSTFMPGGDLLSQGVAPQVPSALAGFTSVFGMGTGGSPPL